MVEDDPELKAAFLASIAECKKLKYVPGYFLKMVAERGAVGAAKDLLDAPAVSDGFTKLYLLSKKHGRQVLDLTVEAIILRPEHRRHFTPQQIQTAEHRLAMLAEGGAL